MGESTTGQDTAAVSGLFTAAQACGTVEAFDASIDGYNDDLARKSQELVVGLLRLTPDPFSRTQFTPGHITCTALVKHPAKPSVLFMHHHRLHRWLLPGGHVEREDASLHAAAAREALEETHIKLDAAIAPVLAGIDVHGIPAKRSLKGDEPYHLHHDLIWCFRAVSDEISISDEAPSVRWAVPDEWDEMGVAESIRRSIRRSC